jgi:chemotaxis protein MotB
MITLLTIFFLMLYSMSVVSKGKFTALAISVHAPTSPGSAKIQPLHPNGKSPLANDAQNYEEGMRNLSQYVEQHNLRDKVQVRQEARGVVISLLSDNMLFVRGSAELQEAGAPIVARVASVLRSVQNPIQVEGHTCDLPMRSALFPSNWELSTARAGAALRAFTERYGIDQERFRAAGYASTRPIVPNVSETNRARNRRVDIVILKTEEQREADVLRRSELRRVLISPRI